MGCNPGGIVGVVSSLKDNARPCLLPVGSVSDGADCRRSLCALNDRRSNSSRELVVRGMLYVCGDGMNMEAVADDSFNGVLRRIKEGSCPSLCRVGRLLMVGWKRWSQKLCSTILRAIVRHATIAPQQTMRCLNST